MATRTQKAAMKKKAEAAKKERAPGKTAKAKAKPAKRKAAAPRASASDPKTVQRTAAKQAKLAEMQARLEGKAPPAKPRKEPEPQPEPEPSGDEGGNGGEMAKGSAHLAVDEPERPVAQGTNGHGRAEVDVQADNVAAELARRRSKPIVVESDDAAEAVPRLPVGRGARGDDDEPEKQVLQLDPAPPAKAPESRAPRGLSIPEHFLLLAVEDGWDERREKVRPGGLGGGLTGALLLELVLQGKVRVQRDRFQVTDVPVDDAAHAVAQRLQELQEAPSLQAMGSLAKDLHKLLPAYKRRMRQRGLIEHREWRHLGMFQRAQVALVDADAQDHLRNKLARAIAGGGRPDAPTILSLGLLEASGLFGVVVPEGAQAYNRKRLNGLLAGKDVMGYKVDDELKGIQEVAVRTILDNVRLMTVRG